MPLAYARAAQKSLLFAKEQVKFIFGTALIQDPFRESRWDYFNSVKVGEKTIAENKLTIFFDENDLVESWIVERSDNKN